MPVNPHHDMILGLPVFPDVAHLPETPDLAVIATPPETVPGLLRRAWRPRHARRGRDHRRLRRARRARPRAAEGRRWRRRGRISCASSGRIASASWCRVSGSTRASPTSRRRRAISPSSASRGRSSLPCSIGPRRAASASRMSSRSATWPMSISATCSIISPPIPARARSCSTSRAITHARKFMSAARAAARAKPVLAVKVGRFAESARAARSHTGALAGSDAVYDAAFRRAGMLRVVSMDELFDAVRNAGHDRAAAGATGSRSSPMAAAPACLRRMPWSSSAAGSRRCRPKRSPRLDARAAQDLEPRQSRRHHRRRRWHALRGGARHSARRPRYRRAPGDQLPDGAGVRRGRGARRDRERRQGADGAAQRPQPHDRLARRSHGGCRAAALRRGADRRPTPRPTAPCAASCIA